MPFIKLDERKPYNFQVWQRYISKVKQSSLQDTLIARNQIAIEEGIEGLTARRYSGKE